MKQWFYPWLAGLIDGDGSFMVSVYSGTTTRISYNLVPKISISLQSNDDGKRTMDYIKQQLGYGTYYGWYGKQQLIEFMVLKGQTCYKLAKKILPYLVLKKKTCEMFLEILEGIKRGEHLNKEGFLNLCAMRDKLNQDSGHQRIKKTVEWYRLQVKVRNPQDRSEWVSRSWETRRKRYGETGYSKKVTKK